MYFISVVCVFLDEQDFRQAVVGLPIFIYLLLLKKHENELQILYITWL